VIDQPFLANVEHAVSGFVVALIFGLLLLAWRDREKVDLDDRLAALLAMCGGLLFGVIWEVLEFVQDWIRYTDVQQSNLDTMTDLLWNDFGAVVGGALMAAVYCHVLGFDVRARLGAIADWLVNGPSQVLDKHGFLVTIVVSIVAAVAVGALWFAGRPIPGFPLG
jgi:hypothetical protein